MDLPKPKSLLGWGVLAAVTAVVKERYTDLTWGDVARAPVQGILNSYNAPKSSGWSKAWNVGVEVTKLGVGIGLMVGATALATIALPAVAATAVGATVIAGGSLVVGGLLSHFVADPLFDKAKVGNTLPTPSSVPQTENNTDPSRVKHYASLSNVAVSQPEVTENKDAPVAMQAAVSTRSITPTTNPRLSA